MLARFRELPALVLDFVEQPDIFDGDRRLIGERGSKLDLLVAERRVPGRESTMTAIGTPSRINGTPSMVR